MTNDPGQNLMLSDDTSGRKGRPKLGPSILRLYRDDVVWRGAVDLIFVGSLIMGLVWGVPDIFSGIGRLFSGPANTGGAAANTAPPMASETPVQPAAVQPSVSPTAPASVPAANFAAAPNVAANNQAPAHPALPKPKMIGGFENVWIGNVSSEDRAQYEAAARDIGIDNRKIFSVMGARAESGDPNAQYLMGAASLSQGLKDKMNADFDSAIRWYKLAGAAGHPAAQYQLGQIYRLSLPGVPIDIAQAIKWYETSANNPLDTTGNSENELARVYEAGRFVSRDVTKAKAYYEAGARKGNAMAEGNLGAMYYNGALGGRDVQQALSWIQKSANDGNIIGQLNLAEMYLRGIVTGKPDYAQFLKWGGLAADQGDTKAMVALGTFYREGRADFPPDQKLAAKYFRLAALKKDPKAQFLLAEMYENGLGLPQDKMQAYVYYSLSYKDGGFAPAYEALQTLDQKLTPQEREYAQKMAQALTGAIVKP